MATASWRNHNIGVLWDTWQLLHYAVAPVGVAAMYPQNHGVAIYGKDTYRKKAAFHLSPLKPEAEMVSEVSRGRYDFDKT